MVKRLAYVMSLVLISSFVLVGCGGAKVDAKLKADCDLIFDNLKAIQLMPEVFEGSAFADGESVALLLGKSTREMAEKKILEKFPFLDDIIIGKNRDDQWSDRLYYYAGSIYLIKQALEGTDVEFPYSNEEMKSIATQKDAEKNIVLPLAKKIFGGDIYDEPQGCDVVDEIRVKEAPDGYLSDYETNVAFHRAESGFLDFAELLQAIRNCQVSGWHEDSKCAKNDYVGGEDTYIPSTEMTEEERQILEERERAKENEDQAPEKNSFARPGQRCVDPDRVVQTEDYGELICRKILLKGLVWVRT